MNADNQRKAAKYENRGGGWGGVGGGLHHQFDKFVGTSDQSPSRFKPATADGIHQHLPADQCPNRLPNRLRMLPKREDRQGRVQ